MNIDLAKRRQYGLVIIALQLAFKVSMLPSLLADIAGPDVYLSIAVMVAIEVMTLIFVYWVSVNNHMDTILNAYGKVAYTLICLPLIFNFIVKTVLLLTEVSSYVSLYLFYNVEHLPILLLLGLAAVYASAKGGRASCRMAELVIWLLPVGLLLIIVFGQTELTYDHILPFADNGATPIFSSVNTYLFYVVDFSPLMFFALRKDGKKSTVPLLILTGAVASVAFAMFFVMNYGNAGRLMGFAFARLAQGNVFDSEIGSIDWPFIVGWLAITVITFSVKSLPVKSLCSVYKVNASAGLVVCYATAILLVTFLFKNMQGTLDFVKGYIKYVCVGIQVLVPIIVVVMGEAAKGKRVESKV